MDGEPVATSAVSSSTNESTAERHDTRSIVASPPRSGSASVPVRVRSPVKRASSSDLEPAAKKARKNASPAPQRRTSTRPIRRKKFDDEVVESSGTAPPKPAPAKPPPAKTPTPKQTQTAKTPVTKTTERKKPGPKKKDPSAAAQAAGGGATATSTPGSSTSQTLAAGKTSSGGEKKTPPVKTTYRKVSKKVKALREVGRWLPTDDLSLITAVQQTNDLNLVHIGVKFSCSFTLRDIQDRWHTLLYDAKASRIAMSRIRELHPEQQAAASANVLWSVEEENILGTVPLNDQAELSTFTNLLQQHRTVFHPRRTAKALRYHFLQMRFHKLHPASKLTDDDQIMMFIDAEDQLNDQEILDMSVDINREKELAQVERQQKSAIRQLESELPKFQEIVEAASGQMEMDQMTLAVLRGVNVRYLMRSMSMTVGRNAADHTVDVDLSLEGPAFKVSRRHATVQLQEDAHFYLTCEGKRAIYVNGQPILPLERARLHHNCIVEICSLSFIFVINVPIVHDTLAKTKEAAIAAAAAASTSLAAAGDTNSALTSTKDSGPALAAEKAHVQP